MLSPSTFTAPVAGGLETNKYCIRDPEFEYIYITLEPRRQALDPSYHKGQGCQGNRIMYNLRDALQFLRGHSYGASTTGVITSDRTDDFEDIF
jgi:hypothetical protein